VLLDAPELAPLLALLGMRWESGGVLPLSLVGPGLLSPNVEDVPLVGTPPEPEMF
jgi:hypothetical protein